MSIMAQLITDRFREVLDELREKASSAPVDMTLLVREIETPEGRARHLAQMHDQSVACEFKGVRLFVVTYSVETGHPCGTCRHMSMSVEMEGKVPNQAAFWTVAEALGFAGSLEDCVVWPETLSDGHRAVNAVQPLAFVAGVSHV